MKNMKGSTLRLARLAQGARSESATYPKIAAEEMVKQIEEAMA